MGWKWGRVMGRGGLGGMVGGKGKIGGLERLG